MMGSMHTGLEDRARDIDRLAEYFAERARGGVGLIITGGYAPNRTGWLLPFAAQMIISRQAAPASPHHQRGARRRRQDPAAGAARGALCLPPVFGERVVDQGPHQPVSPRAGSPVGASRQRSTTSRAAHGWPATPATTASRSWAARAICSTSSSRRARTSAPTSGAAHRRNAGASRWRSCAEPGRPSGRTSSSATGCRWPTTSRMVRVGRNRRAGTRSRSGRRHDHQHRHRLARGPGADDRHVGAQQRVRRHQQRGGRARRHPGGGVQPDQHAAGGGADSRRHATLR